VTEICLEIEDGFKFVNLEARKQKGYAWLVSTALKSTKIQISKFRKIKGLFV
jgi:hypothetical protein